MGHRSQLERRTGLYVIAPGLRPPLHNSLRTPSAFWNNMAAINLFQRRRRPESNASKSSCDWCPGRRCFPQPPVLAGAMLYGVVPASGTRCVFAAALLVCRALPGPTAFTCGILRAGPSGAGTSGPLSGALAMGVAWGLLPCWVPRH